MANTHFDVKSSVFAHLICKSMFFFENYWYKS